MKFNINSSLLKGAIILILCFVLVSSFKGKTKRAASVMEYMNNFFSKSQNAASVENMNKSNDDNHHKKKLHHVANKKKTHFRFKEKTQVESNSKKNETDLVLSDWFMISSPTFKNQDIFPTVQMKTGEKHIIKTDPEYFRLNESFENQTGVKGPSNKFFWFRLSDLHLYYSLSMTDINILGAFKIAEITKIADHGLTMTGNDQSYCFSVKDTDGIQWKVCSILEKTTTMWTCKIESMLGINDMDCNASSTATNPVSTIDRNITQPIIIIPMPSPQCNEGWNYQRNGDDWQCDCAEGSEQSPIDLPSIEATIDSPVKPLFEYEEISPVSKQTTISGQVQKTKPLKIVLSGNSLRIKHHKFGKVVTMDGGVYYAQEIVIHTPSEHLINGKPYDMEVQIIHYGQTKGDIAKQIVLSFVFENKPGVYNQFMDDLDIFNLPNPLAKERDLTVNIYIPKLLFSADDTEIPVMKSFSFYTYQGSLTAPPCTENTIMYVASKPLPIGSTALQLFQEAIRVPDLMTPEGDVIASNWVPINNRKTQARNGRPVFHYDHVKYCGPDPVNTPTKEGHYEKLIKPIIDYFYVDGKEPSGLSNAFVVSESEALGHKLVLPGTGVRDD